MAKRKAAVNDIIYELDNDDSEISSDDEVKHPKIVRLEMDNSLNTTQSDSNTQSSCLEIEDIDSSAEKLDEVHSPKVMRIGGKSPEFIIIDEASDTVSPRTPTTGIERRKKLSPDTIFDEDIIIDSPASNSDPGVVGCENRTPLVTVRFRDSKLAMNYKKKIKAFMVNLLKLHKSSTESDNETDLELDIWPEDLTEDDLVIEPEKPTDNLFFIDTDPCMDMPEDIPSYSQNAAMISNVPDEEPSPTPMFRRKGPTCFNCNGSHTMRECKLPRNNARIAENRKAMVKLGRYHVEDEQKYGHLVAGRISGQLRHALGLKRHELPLHIYRMRQLGYPPGWLEEARISHSGITLFDSSGQATLEPDEEEGEVCEPGSKDKYDIKKILDFPGFNVPASSRYKEDAHKMGLPPLSDQDSKMAMLQILAPNAMKAYKRKKLTFFPSAPGQVPQEGTAEMDIDSGDEVVDFPSQPPLPDDVPPPPPPPPDSPPPPPLVEPEIETTPKTKEETLDPKKKLDATTGNKANKSSKENNKTESDDDVEVIEVMKVGDIPVPFQDLITIDVDGDVSEPENCLVSPSLDDLEQKKRLLLDALDTDVTLLDDTDVECFDDANVVEDRNENDVKDLERNESDKKDLERKESDEKDSESIENAKIDLESEGNDSDKKYVGDEYGKNPVDNNGNEEKDKENNDDNKVEESNDSKIVDVDVTSDVLMNAVNEDGKLTTDILSEIDIIDDKVEDKVDDCSIKKPEVEQSSTNDTPKVDIEVADTDLTKTPISTMGLVKGTTYGTPIINTVSPYLTLPSDDKFAKDICDVINFENLPNSTGKYKKISTLLKKVKSEVDRIQES